MILIFLIFNIIVFFFDYTASLFTCSFPPPDKSFQNEKYIGRWYEIGKIQTAGGAFFEKDCVCTQLNMTVINSITGDSIVDNDCRYKTNTGFWTNVTGILYNENMNQPGKWLETIGNSSPVNYTVISISDDYAVEYDCGTSANGITNYCIHVMSRTMDMDIEQFNELIQMAENMGLNPLNLDVKMTQQEGCS